jgi:hypothetical protein
VSGVVTIGSPATYLGADFGYTGTGSLGDAVWYDGDASAGASADAADRPIPDVAVALRWAGFDGALDTVDDELYATTTDATGAYGFGGLPAGDYRITVDPASLPLGMRSPTWDLDSGSNPSGVGRNLIAASLTAGQVRSDVDFAYTGNGSIGDRVWFDVDGDGTADAGEPGLAGIDVLLVWFGPDGDPATTADNRQFSNTTATDGAYLFSHLPAGSFRVVVDAADLPAGTTPTFDLDGTTHAAHRARRTRGRRFATRRGLRVHRGGLDRRSGVARPRRRRRRDRRLDRACPARRPVDRHLGGSRRDVRDRRRPRPAGDHRRDRCLPRRTAPVRRPSRHGRRLHPPHRRRRDVRRRRDRDAVDEHDRARRRRPRDGPRRGAPGRSGLLLRGHRLPRRSRVDGRGRGRRRRPG